MKIGILSDTHGQVDLALTAARGLILRAAEAVIHCGDVGCEQVLTETASLFKELDIPLYVILGNCDPRHNGLHFHGHDGIRVLGRFGELEFNNRRFALLHGDDETALHETVQSARYDYVLCGHSHTRRDERIGTTRVINPGSAGRGMHPSFALLDLTTDQVLFVTISRGEQ